jgi:hydroxypyruvate isomerase
MPRFSVSLSQLFTELPFLERFEAAARAGFKQVEFMFPYEYSPDVIRNRLERNHLELLAFNLPSGNWAAGDRGIAADPLRRDEFRTGVYEAVKWARALGVSRLTFLAGKAPGASEADVWSTLVANVRYAAEALGDAGMSLMIEPVNTFDVPGVVLSTSRQALYLIEAAAKPNVWLLYDMYHAQRQEGNLVPTLRESIAKIGHIHIANNPGRTHPGTGEINYPFVFAELDRLGYAGYVSLEYIPGPDTTASLRWMSERGYMRV